MPTAPTDSPAPHGDGAFAHWLTACGDDPWAPLSPEAAKPYGFIWGAWLKFLASSVPDSSGPDSAPLATLAWLNATPEQVLQFLNSATRSQKQLNLPSDITRRRYWRVLDRIYAHAQMHGWVAHNPVDGLSPQDRPPREDPQGAILSPAMWRALAKQIPTASDLITARDRAVLLILMHLGISSEEVRNLQIEDVQWPSGEAVEEFAAQASTPSASLHTPQRLPSALRIVGLRAMQTRELDLPAPVAQALHSWLQYRAGYAAMGGQPALFCSRKAPEISTHTVLHLVSKTLKAAAEAKQQPYPPRMGPQVIRNTVIVQWLQSGMPVMDVLEHAGLRTPNALLHLKHLVEL